MARPIELGLVLEGKEAEDFGRMRRIQKSEEHKEMFKEAIRIYKTHKF